MPADVTPPVTLTPITTAWGTSVAADLAELWTEKASHADLAAVVPANIITLNAGEPIPPGTPPGTLVLVVPV